MKTSPGYISLPHYRYFSVTGDKTLSFLQGQFTCDVNQVSESQAVFGAYLDIKGRVISTLRLLKADDKLLLQLPESMVATVIPRLTRVAMLSRVKLTPEPELTTIGIIGTHTETDFSLYPVSVGQAEQLMLIGTQKSVKNLLEKHTFSDPNVWIYGLIQSRLVEVDAQTTGQFTPHDLDLPAQDAVSFTKGCYVGQEIVARMQYLGKLKQHLQQLQWPTPPERDNNTPLYDENQQVVGHIVMLCTLGSQQHALAVVRDNAVVKLTHP